MDKSIQRFINSKNFNIEDEIKEKLELIRINPTKNIETLLSLINLKG